MGVFLLLPFVSGTLPFLPLMDVKEFSWLNLNNYLKI